MDMMIVVSIIVLAVVMIVAYNGLKTKQPSDSILRQRAVFNADEHLTFSRLKEILPDAHIFAHVSFDALLTTKFPRTRRKYQTMFADFVVLDQDCRVMAVVALGDAWSTKRSHSTIHQDALIESAGYKLIRYEDVPEYQQLREDFLAEIVEMQHEPIATDPLIADAALGKFEMYSATDLAKSRIYG